MTSARRARSYCRQPFDEARLADVPFADRAEPAGEILTRTLFPGDNAQIMQKACRLVISSGVAAADFGLDLTPDAFAPPRANSTFPGKPVAVSDRMQNTIGFENVKRPG